MNRALFSGPPRRTERPVGRAGAVAGRRLAAALLALGVAGCGGGGGAGSQAGLPGAVTTDATGRLFVVDPNRSGAAPELRLVDVFWGRLVDVHDVDGAGVPGPRPVLRDFVIQENLVSDGSDYVLETNPVTQRTRLVIRRTYDPATPGGGAFGALLRAAEAGLAPVLVRAADGSAAPPFSLVARNACLVLRFDDLLDDSAASAADLANRVRLTTGYPPRTPFEGRVLFDPNHGGLTGGRFHSTRVLFDLAVSEAEAAQLPEPVPPNALGLPASIPTSVDPNGALRLPTRTSFPAGQFAVLENLSGAPLASVGNGPIDVLSPTRDVVRAFRSGNAGDVNTGFLLDFDAPRLLGTWSIFLSGVGPLPGDTSGVAFEGDVTFLGPCRKTPLRGDVLGVGSDFFRVSRNASAPNAAGTVPDVRLELLGDAPQGPLVGGGFLFPLYDPALDLPGGCWLRISPEPGLPPDRDVSTSMQAIVRFSEPMEPTSLEPLENFRLVRGSPGLLPAYDTVVVGTVESSSDLREFRFTPALPLAHRQDTAQYYFRFDGFADLAGNALQAAPTVVPIFVDPDEDPQANGGISMFFDTPDEVVPDSTGADLRGQFFYDFQRGTIRPRPVTFASAVADRVNPVPGIMIPFAPGVQTPLSPLGSKLQTVWRYADFGWQVLDETLYNLDVLGINWAPIEGQVISDFYPNFEMRLSHTMRMPVECRDAQYGLPLFPGSGLRNDLFANNVLVEADVRQDVVHERSLGYAVSPVDRFVASSGRIMMPFPWNKGADVPATYTWRDTRSSFKGGPGSRGLPMCIEIGQPLALEDPPPRRVRPENEVPTFGLPLLMEFRTFPSDSGVGLNAFDISLASNSSIFPYFRTYSTGGTDTSGNLVRVQPDLEDRPQGGFNPSSSPPGRRTPSADPSFYIGQLDYVVKISMVNTVWIDARPATTSSVFVDYFPAVVLPPPDSQPPGTEVILEFRGADGFVDVGPNAFDSARIDIYGDVFEIQSAEEHDCENCIRPVGTVLFHDGQTRWTADVDDLDGASYFQVRMTFVGNIASRQIPELAALGFPFAYE